MRKQKRSHKLNELMTRGIVERNVAKFRGMGWSHVLRIGSASYISVYFDIVN